MGGNFHTRTIFFAIMLVVIAFCFTTIHAGVHTAIIKDPTCGSNTIEVTFDGVSSNGETALVTIGSSNVGTITSTGANSVVAWTHHFTAVAQFDDFVYQVGAFPLDSDARPPCEQKWQCGTQSQHSPCTPSPTAAQIADYYNNGTSLDGWTVTDKTNLSCQQASTTTEIVVTPKTICLYDTTTIEGTGCLPASEPASFNVPMTCEDVVCSACNTVSSCPIKIGSESSSVSLTTGQCDANECECAFVAPSSVDCGGLLKFTASYYTTSEELAIYADGTMLHTFTPTSKTEEINQLFVAENVATVTYSLRLADGTPIPDISPSTATTVSVQCGLYNTCNGDQLNNRVMCGDVPTAGEIATLFQEDPTATWIDGFTVTALSTLNCPAPDVNASVVVNPSGVECVKVTPVAAGGNSYTTTTATGCAVINPPAPYPLTCPSATCTACDALTVGSCGASFGGQTFNWDDDRCDSTCNCQLSNLETEPTTAACGDTVTVTWQWSQPTLTNDVKATLEVKDANGDVVLSLPNVPLDTETVTFDFSVNAEAGAFSVSFLDYPSVTASIELTNDCVLKWFCTVNEEAPVECQDVTNLTPTTLLEITTWAITTTCNAAVQVTPNSPTCYVNGEPQDDAACTSIGLAKPTQDTLDITTECTAVCSSDTCNSITSCSAQYELSNQESVTVPTTVTCPSNSCACTTTNFALTSATTINCGDNVVFTWDHTGQAPDATSDLKITVGTNPPAIIPVNLAAKTYTYVWNSVATGAITFTFAGMTIDDPVVGTACTYTWKCIDSEGEAVDSCQTQFESTLCTVCNGELGLDVDQDYKCFSADEVVDNQECVDLQLPPPTLNCSCKNVCKIISSGEEPQFALCTESSTWAQATTCGNVDTRSDADFRLQTKTGALLPCTEECADEIPTSQLTVANVELCSTVAQCDMDEAEGGLIEWKLCSEQDTGAFNCDVVTPSTCPQTLQRTVRCAIVAAGDVSLVKTDEKTLKDVLIAHYDTDVDAGSAIDTAIDTLVGTCSSSIDVETTLECKCKQELWCMIGSSDDPPTVDAIISNDAQLCTQENFPQCPKACMGADVSQSQVDQTRNVYCRGVDGSFSDVLAVEDTCGSVAVTDADVKKECPIDLDCKTGNFCLALSEADYTDAQIASESANITLGADGVAICSSPSSYGSNCYLYDTPETTFVYKQCTFLPDESGTDTNDYVGIVASKCLVFVEDANSNPVALETSTVTGNLCDGGSTFPTQLPDCTDFEGCSLGMTPIVVYDAGDIELGSEHTDNVDQLDLSSYQFVWSQLGVISLDTKVVFEWAYKIGATTAADTNMWYLLSVETDLQRYGNEFTYDFSTINFNFAAAIDNKLTIYIRAFVIDADEVDYPLTLVITRDQSCATNDTFTGINEECADENGVATLKCTVSPITSTSTTPTGRCSRNATCDTQSESRCKNDGFLTVASATSCSLQCHCINGFNPTDDCETCVACPATRGIAKTEGCGCDSCYDGFTSPGTLCDTCVLSATITTQNPSTAIVAIIDETANDTENIQYSIFKSAFISWVSSVTNFFTSGIDIDLAESSTGTNTVTLKMTFTGDCTTIALTPAKFITLATTNNLSAITDNFDSAVTPTTLTEQEFAMFLLKDETSSINIQSSLIPPTLHEAEEPSTPEEESDGTDIVVIIVPIIVVVVVIIVVAVVVYICVFKDRSGSDSSSSSPAATTSDGTPKAQKSQKPKNNDYKAADASHLELV